MQEAFDKLRGVDIFSLKSYMEPTGFASFNGAWVLINELFVNFFFFILNAVVGFFSLLIRILEKIDLYSNYKNYLERIHRFKLWWSRKAITRFNVATDSSVLSLLSVFLFERSFFKNTPSCLSSSHPWFWLFWNNRWNIRGAISTRYH